MSSPQDSIELTVVVPSVNGWLDLEGCLAALAAERETIRLEVVVVDRCGEAVRERVRSRFPWVRLIEAGRGTTIPELRAMAFAEARGASVAVIEDHVLVPAGWGRQLLSLQRAGEDVVGGALENAATGSVVDWAAFLCEYSHLLPPLPEGPVTSLPGNNTVYRRDLLEKYREVAGEGRWEDYLHRCMLEDGIVLYSRPAVRVRHKKHYTVTEYLSQRYLYSRSFAAMRLMGKSLAQKIGYGFAAFGLPPLLLLRIVRTVWRKKTHRLELVKSLPLIAVFVGAAGWGEVVGAWMGPGDALARVC
jgi:hypothetical protein